ncbi:MAG: glycosyltransferase family 4 protein [Candidatus Freyarchaeota archaeon]|nr:glycosyltransferase family 4 protein [Candidatus Freyrarchaeum guaymaensis]HDO81476.1 glycosyltransferase family 1 protein [Candidatus Bathyarchaeota archaeon]
MKICLLSYRGNMSCGGQGVYLYYVSRELARLGHDVHVIVGPPYPFEMDWATVHKIKTPQFSEFTGERLTAENLSVLSAYEYTAASIGVFPEMFSFSIRAFFKVKELIKKERFDIIHDNQSLGYGLLLMKALGMPVVATIHHPLTIDRIVAMRLARTSRERFKQILFYPMFMQKVVARFLDKVVTVSNTSARNIRKHFKLPWEKIKVIHNGVDTDVFRMRDGGSRDGDYYRLMFVGNTDNRVKGVSLLLRALKYMKEELELNVKLTIVDRWKEEGLAPPLIKEYGLEEDVSFTGFLTVEELAQHYAMTDLVIISSMFEGFCFVAAEAMACGKPVVGFRVGALPEVVENGSTGILVEPGNWKALAHAAAKVLEDRELRERMGRNGRRRVEKLYTWEKVARELEEVYMEVLDANHKP